MIIGMSLTIPILMLDVTRGLAPGARMARTVVGDLGVFGIGVTTAIVGLFIFGLLRYLRPVWRIRRAFQAAVRRLEADRAQRAPFPARPKHLNNLWARFLDDRAGTTVRVGTVEISTIDPEEIFTEQAVLQGYNRNMALTLAGMFTGLGILGTFIGLVAGLSTIRGTDPDQVLQGVTGLLSGMHTAFYTSIVGISFSLLWLFLDRELFHRLQRQVSEFFLAAKRVYPVESADRLLHRLVAVEQDESAAIHRTNDILAEHGRLFEEQKAILQTLGTDLAVAFQDALNNSLGTQLTPVLQGVIQAVENISTQLGDRQVAAMDRLVAAFQERLSDQLSGQFENLAESLQKAAEWQQRVHAELDELLTRVGEATEGQRGVIERSTEACDLFQRSMGQLEKSHTLIAKSAEHLEGVAGRLTKGLEEFGERLVSRLEETAKTVGDMTDALTAAVERIDLQARSLEARIEQLDAQQEVYRTANEEIRTYLAQHIDALSEQVASLNGFWLQFRDDLSAVGKELRGSVTEFSVFTADKLKEIFARFDAEMAKVVEHLSGTLAEIREVTEDLPAGVERLRTSFEGAVQPIASAGRAIQQIPESLEGLQTLGAEIERLRHSLDGAASPTPLGDTLRQVALEVGGTRESIQALAAQLEAASQRVGVAVATNGAEVAAE